MAVPEQIYSCQLAINAGSTAGETFSFGFSALMVQVENLGAVDLFANLTNQAATSAGRPVVSTCGDHRVLRVQMDRPWCLGVGLTTTSTAAGGQTVRVLAIGTK